MSKIGHFFHHLGHDIKHGFQHLGHDIKSGWHHVEHGLDKGLHELVHNLKDPLFDVGLLCDALGFVVGPEMEVVGGALMAGRVAAKAGRAAAKAVDAGRALKNAGKITTKTAKAAGKGVDHVEDAKDKIEEIKDKKNGGVKDPALLSSNSSPTMDNPAEVEKVQQLLMMMQLMAASPALTISPNAFNGESINFSTNPNPMPLEIKVPEEGIETSQRYENLKVKGGAPCNFQIRC